jgi:hypothetical protein
MQYRMMMELLSFTIQEFMYTHIFLWDTKKLQKVKFISNAKYFVKIQVYSNNNRTFAAIKMISTMIII